MSPSTRARARPPRPKSRSLPMTIPATSPVSKTRQAKLNLRTRTTWKRSIPVTSSASAPVARPSTTRRPIRNWVPRRTKRTRTMITKKTTPWRSKRSSSTSLHLRLVYEVFQSLCLWSFL